MTNIRCAQTFESKHQTVMLPDTQSACDVYIRMVDSWNKNGRWLERVGGWEGNVE